VTGLTSVHHDMTEFPAIRLALLMMQGQLSHTSLPLQSKLLLRAYRTIIQLHVSNQMNWTLPCSGWLADHPGTADQTLTSGRRVQMIQLHLPRVRSSLFHVFDLLFLLTTPIRTDWAERPSLWARMAS
jgi:hypothetical protein